MTTNNSKVDQTQQLFDSIKELVDWHIVGFVHLNGDDCGCAEEEQQEWAEHWVHVGDQAYSEHLLNKIVEAIKGSGCLSE